jgi:hypothetical protein
MEKSICLFFNNLNKEECIIKYLSSQSNFFKNISEYPLLFLFLLQKLGEFIDNKKNSELIKFVQKDLIKSDIDKLLNKYDKKLLNINFPHHYFDDENNFDKGINFHKYIRFYYNQEILKNKFNICMFSFSNDMSILLQKYYDEFRIETENITEKFDNINNLLEKNIEKYENDENIILCCQIIENINYDYCENNIKSKIEYQKICHKYRIYDDYMINLMYEISNDLNNVFIDFLQIKI